jgi:predicted ATP-grasp superfamily ATP-dependent carboligase
MADVFVPDGRSIASVGIVRSLGEKGIDVTLGNERKVSAAAFSKYVRKNIVYPSPEKKPELFLSEMYNLIKREKFDVVMPVRDSTTMLFSKMKDKFSEHTKLPISDYRTFVRGRNKAQTVKVALDSNIPCPFTYFDGDDDIKKLKDKIEYPVLIRPCESSGSRGIVYIDTPENLLKEYYKIKNQFGEVMIQEYIPHVGKAYNVSALFNKYSEPRAVFAMEKVRQFPISGGPTAFAVSIKGDEVKKYALKLLKDMNWVGVAEVEFIFDERDKKPKLMEINPRFWNPLSLAIHSGVDFPSLLYEMAINDDIKPVTDYQLGVKWRYSIYDFLCFIYSSNKIRNFSKFATFTNVHDAMFSLDDPGPAFGSILDGFASILSKERREHVFKRG